RRVDVNTIHSPSKALSHQSQCLRIVSIHEYAGNGLVDALRPAQRFLAREQVGGERLVEEPRVDDELVARVEVRAGSPLRPAEKGALAGSVVRGAEAEPFPLVP